MKEKAGFAEMGGMLNKKLPQLRRAPVVLSQNNLTETKYLPGGKQLPVIIEPLIEGLNLAVWIKDNSEAVERLLLRNGGVLFRGFDMNAEEDFKSVLESSSLNLMHYIEGATPRTELGDKVYTSTEYPADQSIALHNELTYVITWPMRICFFCKVPAQTGGETPIADVRRVFNRIAPEIRDRFIEKGWMLVRNFGDGLSLPWQSAFRTSSRSEVEDYCKQAQIEVEWKANDRLRTRQVRGAVAKHPRTGETIWFNHVAFWHVSSLDPKVREAMISVFDEENLPYNTYYGDGSPIEDSTVDVIRQAYAEETVQYSWRKGDLLMLDNMLVAHGRNPYSGPRSILVAMGDPWGARGV
jgi:alpha-ketoglutarate-dependent taurine dioxygenase